MLNLQRRLENESAVVRIVQLRSEQNAADPASRGTTCTTDLYQRCCNAFAAARNGIRIGEYIQEYAPTGAVRHEDDPGEDDLDILRQLYLSNTVYTERP